MNLFTRLLATVFFLPGLTAVAQDRVEFNRDIRPILSENCFACHGFDAEHREADLRLDTFEGATEFDTIVPGKPDESELLNRVVADDPDEVMPPPETEKQLSQEQIELLKRWIDQGAEYQEHWAWKALLRPTVPATHVSESKHDSNPATSPDAQVSQTPRGPAAIDAFLEAGWKSHSVSSVEVATPRERLRRLSFDLRGLPPTASEVSRFESDPSDETFFDLRDRWMDELAYAEHQAVRWLDLVRWADTSGFVSDEPIASGAYRSWIINAINQNMPFDQFSIQQLAGDLLPDATDGQLVASGYNRIVNTNCEAGAIEAEQLYKLKGEHVRAVGTVWMGMTTGCAECHDHKFDPFSAKDYYSLAAFFDDLVEAGVYTPGDRREPLHYVHDQPETSKRDRKLAEMIEALRDEIDGAPLVDLEDWQRAAKESLNDTESRGEFAWITAQLPAMRILEGTFDSTTIEGRIARETKADEGQFHRHHAAELITGPVAGGDAKAESDDDAWFADVWIDPENRPKWLAVQISHGMYGRLGWKTANYETYYWGDDSDGVLSKPHPWSDPKRVKRVGDVPSDSGWVRLRVPLNGLIKPVSGQSFDSVGMAWLHGKGHVGWGDSGLELRADKVASLQLAEPGMRKWWEKPKNRQVYQRRNKLVAAALQTDASKRDALQQELVLDAYRDQNQTENMARLRALESELYTLRARAIPVLVSRQADRRKTTRLLHRGDYQDESGPILTPAVPEFLGEIPTDQMASRLDLARWLFDQGDALVARVYVNRLWHQFYGRGLSETLEDSGTQGDWPSNVSLLDWLACEFRDSGWDRDHLVKLLTSTKAYQLSSRPTAELQRRDPGNRWHARQGRYRLTAEQIRDSALHAAGLLNVTTDVPTESFFPYQPSPYWTRSDKVMYGSRHMIWATSADRSQYLRSVYTFWKRQNIHPTMLAFDAPTRQECTARRNITNTPGQALALLNDPIFVEAARVFAADLLSHQPSSDDDRIDRAFEQALQRSPSMREKHTLKRLVQNQRAHYRENPDAADALLSIGQKPPTTDEDATEIAAWTAVTRAILNLHEFLNRS